MTNHRKSEIINYLNLMLLLIVLMAILVLSIIDEDAPKIENYWIWSSFATKALNEMGHKHVKTMHGCIDTSNFYRLSDEKRRIY